MSSQSDEFVFRALRSIAPLGIARGFRSQVIYTPLDPISQIQVISHMPPGYEDDLLRNLDRLQLVYQTPSRRSALEHLFRALQIRESA